MAGALDGIRVIDLTMWFQGPVAGQHLADMGAEVIHFENPRGGDLGRGIRSIKALPVGDWNQYFLVINRNKKSMAVDLNKPEGREIMYRLVECSDVFLTNLSDTALKKWQVGYEDLSRLNPRLVYAVGSGYGPYGEIKKPSFDLTVQALTGLMSRLGEPGEPPIYLGMGSGDAMGGLMAALGITLGLYARQRTGRGQFLDASLYGAQLFMAAPSLQAYLATGDSRYSEQRSRTTASNPLWNSYRAEDGWLVVCATNDNDNWNPFCEGIGDPGLASDARFDSPEKRAENAAELIELLDKVLRRRAVGEWLERWQRLGIACSRVCDFADLAKDPQAWENDYFVKAHCAEVNEEVDLRGFPISFGKTPGEIRALGPELGQDTELILADTLGYSWDRISGFKAQGVIL
ncbi:MAG: CaiB/BaiF CoA transferase family protein [Candidatus Binatia bacterium]